MLTTSEKARKLDHAFRTERDYLRRNDKSNLPLANELNSFVQNVDDAVKARMYDLIAAHDTPATALSEIIPVAVEGQGIKITAQVEVPVDAVLNAVIGALEGGFSDWMHSFQPATDDETQKAERNRATDEIGTIWYARPSFWANGGKADVVFDLPTDAEGAGNGKVTVGLNALHNGLNIMAQKEPRHFADLVNENDDATTHDVFMQMVVLGEIVYG